MTDRSWLCLKVRYEDQDSAEQALEDARHDRGKPKGRNVRKVERRTYYHPPCDAWHLTSRAAR